MIPLVYIIVINYNNYEDTIECVESLKRIEYKNYKILVIDNNSDNDSVNMLKSSFKDIAIVEIKKNLGFAGGNNVGIRIAIDNGAKFVLLINNDTVVNSNILDKLLGCSNRNSNAGIIGGKIYSYYDKVISEAGGSIDFFKFTTTNNIANELNLEKKVSFISGCCMFIKIEVFQKVGLLPEEYFMYYEDTDFCVKALEKGYDIIYNPEAVIFHKISSSSGGKESPFSIKWNNRNRIIFMYKYRYKVNVTSFICSEIYFYTTRLLRLLQYLIENDHKRACAIYSGIKEGRSYVQSKHYNTLL